MRASYHPRLWPVVPSSSAWPPRAQGRGGPVTAGSHGAALRRRASFGDGGRSALSASCEFTAQSSPFPSVPLWLFYKMHFLQKHRKTGTALPLTCSFNLQLSCWAPMFGAIQIHSETQSASPHSFSTMWPHAKVKIIKWFKLKHWACLVNKSTSFFYLCLYYLQGVPCPVYPEWDSQVFREINFDCLLCGEHWIRCWGYNSE